MSKRFLREFLNALMYRQAKRYLMQFNLYRGSLHRKQYGEDIISICVHLHVKLLLPQDASYTYYIDCVRNPLEGP